MRNWTFFPRSEIETCNTRNWNVSKWIFYIWLVNVFQKAAWITVRAKDTVNEKSDTRHARTPRVIRALAREDCTLRKSYFEWTSLIHANVLVNTRLWLKHEYKLKIKPQSRALIGDPFYVRPWRPEIISRTRFQSRKLHFLISNVLMELRKRSSKIGENCLLCTTCLQL